MNAVGGERGGTPTAPGGPARPAAPASSAGAVRPAGDGAAKEAEAGAAAAEEDARRLARRRSHLEGLAALALLAILLCVDRLPGFLLALAVVQVLAWPLYAVRRGRAAGPGTPALAATSFGRAWFGVLWVALLGTVFLESRTARLLVSVLLASTAAAAPAARANALRVRLARRLPTRARAGTPTAVVYRLEDGTSRPAAGLVVRDAFGLDARPAAIEAAFDLVPARGSAEASTPVVFERRGLRRLRPALVATRHPLGLFAAGVETHAPAEVLVWPRQGRPTATLLQRLRGGSSASGRLVSARAGSDHFHGLREFRDGDDPRRVHWKTTARRQVKTFVEWREDQARRVTVALARSGGKGPEHDRLFERAVSVAATVLEACARAGIPARLVLGTGGAEGERGTEVRGRRGLAVALDALALVRAGAARRPETAFDRFERDPAGETLVWVAPDADADATRRAEASRRGGAGVLLLRADDARLRRWVQGLP